MGRDGWQFSAPFPSLGPLTSWAATTLAYAMPSLAEPLLILKHPGGDTVSFQPTCPLMEAGGHSREHECQQETGQPSGQTFFINIRMFLTHLLEKHPEDGRMAAEGEARLRGPRANGGKAALLPRLGNCLYCD